MRFANIKNYIKKHINKKILKEFLVEEIEYFSPRLGGATISLSFRDLNQTIAQFNINGKKIGWAASIIKVPIMIEVLNQISQGKLTLEDKLITDHRYALEPFDNVTASPAGTAFSVKELLYYMIAHSDNEAANLLADKVGIKNINGTTTKLGAKKTMLAHLLAYDVPRLYSDFNPKGSNITTANDMTNLLHTIYTHKTGDKQNCEYMVKLLEGSLDKWLGIYLPEDTLIGNKIGLIDNEEFRDDVHDVGVVNRDYVLSIMINKIGKDDIKKNKQLCQLCYYPNNLMREANKASPHLVLGLLSKAVYEGYYDILGDKK